MKYPLMDWITWTRVVEKYLADLNLGLPTAWRKAHDRKAWHCMDMTTLC